MNKTIIKILRSIIGLLGLVLFTLFVFLVEQSGTALAETPTTPNTSFWSPNAAVYSIAKLSNTVYLGGDFTYVGPYKGNGIPFTVVGATAQSTYPQVEGVVYSVIPDNSGGWYVGGEFTRIGSSDIGDLAHILSDGTLDASWNPAPDGAVNCLLLLSDTLYVGGNFINIGGQSNSYVAAVNVSDGLAKAGWDAQANDYVNALAISGSTLYVGGYFTSIGGSAYTGLASLNTSDGSAAVVEMPSVDSEVKALALSGNNLYVGGDFTDIGGTARNNIALVDITNGNVDGTWDPDASSYVNSLEIADSFIYAAGNFTTIGSATRNYIAKLNNSTGEADSGWDPNADGEVYSLKIFGTNIFVGGAFTSIAGQTRHYGAYLTLSDATAGDWQQSFGNSVRAIAIDANSSYDDYVYFGGDFNSIGGVYRNSLAALDTTTGEATAWNPNANSGGGVQALAISGSTLFAGGSLSSIGGSAVSNIAAINLSDGMLSVGWSASVDSSVTNMVVDGDRLYIGGAFTTVNGVSQNRVAALNSSDGSLVTAFDPSIGDGTVEAIVTSGNSVYLGGSFTSVNGSSRSGGCQLSSSDGSLLTGWNPNFVGTVNSIVLSDNTLYSGGLFTKVGGVAGTTRNRLASFNLSDYSLTSWNPGLDYRGVETLKMNDDESLLYVVGEFTTVDSTNRPNMAVFNTSDGSLNDWKTRADDTVWDVIIEGENVYVGGAFTKFGITPANYFTQFGTLAPTPTPTLTVTPTSVPTSTPTPAASAVATATPTPDTSCRDQKPSHAPDLYYINRTPNSITLYFAPAGTPYDKYNISYGVNSDASDASMEFSQSVVGGAIVHILTGLSPTTDYYFKVRGKNGCADGDWSSSRLAKVTWTNIETRSEYADQEVDLYLEPTVTSSASAQITPVAENAASINISLPENSDNRQVSFFEPTAPILPQIVIPLNKAMHGNIVSENTGKLISTANDFAVPVTTTATVSLVSFNFIFSFWSLSKSLFALPLRSVSSFTRLAVAASTFLPAWPSFFIGSLSGLKTRRKQLGVVVDSITNTGLNGAFIMLYSASGNIATGLSNISGNFYFFFIKPDSYKLKVEMVGYDFPSKILTVRTNQKYQRIYQGEDLVVSEDSLEALNVAVPADPSGRKLTVFENIYLKGKAILGYVYVKYYRILAVFFCLFSIYSYIFNPSRFHLLTVILVSGFLVLKIIDSFGNIVLLKRSN